MRLDVGCGSRRKDGFTGLDIRAIPVDNDIYNFKWDITQFPWPIDDDSCSEINMSYVWGAIEPKSRIAVMDELWRIMQPDGVLTLTEQHSASHKVLQDPTYYSGVNEYTFTYFDNKYKRYEVYKPKPWHILDMSGGLVCGIVIRMEANKNG